MIARHCETCRRAYIGDFCTACNPPSDFPPPGSSYVSDERLADALANPPGPRHAIVPGASGLKYDGGKPPWHLLAWDAIRLVVLVLAFGAKKYADRNWEKGIAHSRTFAAAQRHMFSWYQDREDTDPETGIHHLAHAICELMFALAFDARKMHHVTVQLPLENGTSIEVELDNRPGKLVA